MAYNVVFTDEFEVWWNDLTAEEQEDIDAGVRLLEIAGPTLKFPYSSGITGSAHPRMRELRIQHKGRPYRILYVFDSQRSAVLLIGGDKTGDDRWYEKAVPLADRLYDQHLDELKKEGKL